MITGTTTDYTFRKVDLSMFPAARNSGVQYDAELIGPSGVSVITGHSKGAQNFFRILMTPLGYYRSTPNFGSNFRSRVYSGNIVLTEDLPNLFAIESARVVDFIVETASRDVPKDELVSEARLGKFSVDSTSLAMEVILEFLDPSDSELFTLPLPLQNFE